MAQPLVLSPEAIPAQTVAPIDTTLPPEQNQETVSIDLGSNANIPASAQTAQKRAYKAQLAMEQLDLTHSYQDIYNAMVNGDETNLRNEMAAQQDYKNSIKMEEVVADVAKKKGGPLSPSEYSFLLNEIDKRRTVTDPTSVIEDKYAQKYVSELDKTDAANDTVLSEAKKDFPKEVEQLRQEGSIAIAKVEFARKLAEDVQDEIGNQSTIGFTTDLLKQFAPFYNEFKIRGNVQGVPWLNMLGTNLEEQRKKILDQPYADYKNQLTSIVTNLRKDNPQMALQFLMGVMGQSTSEQFTNNLNTVLDATTIPAFAIAKRAGNVAKALRTKSVAEDVTDAVKNMVKSSLDGDPSGAKRAEASGDVAEAAVQKNTLEALKEARGEATEPQSFFDSLFSFMRTDATDLASDTGRLSKDFANKLKEQYETFETSLTKTVDEMVRVQRIPAALATENGIRALKESVIEKYPGLSNAVLDISKPTRTPAGNYTVAVSIGKPGGELFYRPMQAKQFAAKQGILNYEVKKQGLGYYLQVNKNVDETSNVIRDVLLSTADSRTPGFERADGSGIKGWINAVAGRLRTTEDTLSVNQSENRKIAAYGPNQFLKLVHEEAQAISDLASGKIKYDPVTGEALSFGSRSFKNVAAGLPFKRNQRWEDWNRLLKAGRELIDPDTKQKGYFFKSLGEIDSWYQTYIGRQVSNEEAEAYFAYKRILEMDRAFRNMAVYKNKARLGTEQHRIAGLNESNEKVFSNFFDGVARKEFPGGDGTVMVIDGDVKSARVYVRGQGAKPIPTKVLAQLKEDVKNGRMRVIELYDPESRPLQGFGDGVGDARVRYVVTSQLESKPLDWLQVPRRGGGHFDYDYDFYIKGPKIRVERAGNKGTGNELKFWYEGDVSIMPIQNRAMGQDIVNKLNEYRKLLRGGREEEAKAFAEANLPMSHKEMKAWFNPKFVEGKKQPPMLNINHEIRLVPRDKYIVDLDKTLENSYAKGFFEDGTKSGSLARQFQVQYTGERDADSLFTLKDEGTRGNPLYKVIPADLVDPIPSLNRALKRIINTTYMDDYKTYSVEHWIREAAPYLKADESELRSAPFYHFSNPVFKTGADPAKVANLKTTHFQIRQFTGMKNEVQTVLHSAAQTLSDQVYRNIGPTKLGNRLLDGLELATTKDPVAAMRGFTFHAKLGFWNLPQLLVQAQTFANIIGIAGPRHAAQGSYATLLHQWSRINGNPEILAKLDEYATKLKFPGSRSWKPGEWLEARNEMMKTGFGNVGREYALVDDALGPKTVQTTRDRFLSAGDVFFREGEQATRYGAWYTAFREFREANPFRALTDADRAKILQRADLLSVNMSRASNSALHSGIMSIPAQFLSYQIRQAELFLSNRITWQQRANLLLWNAALYGAPVATGITGFPFGDFWKKSAIENGYVVGDNFVRDLVENGIPAMLIALITGKGDPSAGNVYNIGDRYGNQGFEWIKEAMRSDNTWWTLLGGAAFSTLGNTVASFEPFYQATMSVFRDDDQAFPLKTDDFVDVFKEISSVNSAWRSIMAANTGKWMSKKEVNISENVSLANNIFMTATGLSSQDQADLESVSWSKKSEQELQKLALNKFVREFRRGVLSNTDPEQTRDYLTRAITYLKISGFPEERYPEAFRMATRGNEELIGKVDWSYYMKNVPENKKDARYKAFQRKLQIQDKRNGE